MGLRSSREHTSRLVQQTRLPHPIVRVVVDRSHAPEPTGTRRVVAIERRTRPAAATESRTRPVAGTGRGTMRRVDAGLGRNRRAATESGTMRSVDTGLRTKRHLATELRAIRSVNTGLSTKQRVCIGLGIGKRVYLYEGEGAAQVDARNSTTTSAIHAPSRLVDLDRPVVPRVLAAVLHRSALDSSGQHEIRPKSAPIRSADWYCLTI